MTEHKYEKELFLSILCEKCERYDDMYDNVQTFINTIDTALNHEQQILVSNAFKHKITSLRNALSIISIQEHNEMRKASPSKEYALYLKEYHNKLMNEFELICATILDIIDTKLLPKANNDESKLLYFKMKGDYLRYIVENMKDEDKYKKYSNLGFNAYKRAMEAGKTLSWTNEIKLEMMLNLSVYYADIIGNFSQGIANAKETIASLEKEVKNIREDDEKLKGVWKIKKNLLENIEMWETETEEIGKN